MEQAAIIEIATDYAGVMDGIEKVETLDTDAFDILYEGWIEYRKKIKGWPAVQKCDILDWEAYKKYIFDKMEGANG